MALTGSAQSEALRSNQKQSEAIRSNQARTGSAPESSSSLIASTRPCVLATCSLRRWGVVRASAVTVQRLVHCGTRWQSVAIGGTSRWQTMAMTHAVALLGPVVAWMSALRRSSSATHSSAASLCAPKCRGRQPAKVGACKSAPMSSSAATASACPALRGERGASRRSLSSVPRCREGGGAVTARWLR